VQHLVNHAQIARAWEQALGSAHAKYYLFSVLFIAIAVSAGANTAAIWLGVTLLLDEVRTALLKRLFSQTRQHHARFPQVMLGLAADTMLALAPALAWFSRAPLGETVALGLMAMMAVFVALDARHTMVSLTLRAAPFAFLCAAIMLDAALRAAPASAVASLALCTIAAYAARRHAKSAEQVRRDYETEMRVLLEQLASSDPNRAHWRLDLKTGALSGAQALSDVFARRVGAQELVATRGWSLDADRDLAAEVFAPRAGATRRIAVEHDARTRDGAVMRVRHQAFVQCDDMGAPIRVTCVSSTAERASIVSLARHVGADAPRAEASDLDLNVLVVESATVARGPAARALMRAGFAVASVGGGVAGLERAREHAPAVMVIDADLPDISGWRLLEALKADARTMAIPVIMLSGAGDRGEALYLGAADHVAQPLDRNVLAAAAMRLARPAQSQTATSTAVQGAA